MGAAGIGPPVDLVTVPPPPAAPHAVGHGQAVGHRRLSGFPPARHPPHLPAPPDGPMTITISPARMSRSTSRSAVTSWAPVRYTLVTFRAERIASASCGRPADWDSDGIAQPFERPPAISRARATGAWIRGARRP